MGNKKKKKKTVLDDGKATSEKVRAKLQAKMEPPAQNRSFRTLFGGFPLNVGENKQYDDSEDDANDLELLEGACTVSVERSVKGFRRNVGRENVILLSGRAMDKHGFVAGQLVSVYNSHTKTTILAQTWLFKTLSEERCRVELDFVLAAHYGPGTVLSVRRLIQPAGIAASVTLTPCAVNPEAEISAVPSHVHALLKHQLRLRAVCPQLVLSFKPFTKHFAFRVTSLTQVSSNISLHEAKSQQDEHLEDGDEDAEDSYSSLQCCQITADTIITFNTAQVSSVTVNEPDGEFKATNAPEDPFSGVGGLTAQVASVREVCELSLLKPEMFLDLGISPPNGLLLHGPPGTGKTLIARTIAKATSASFFSFNAPELISKYVGETERQLNSLFAKAHAAAPAIIFIDEIDAISASRDAAEAELNKRMVACLLTLMDGMSSKLRQAESDAVSKRVIVIGATNRVDVLDRALRRPGRFDREIEIGIPNATERHAIIEVLLRTLEHRLSADEISELAAHTHAFVGADLKALIQEAGRAAFVRVAAGDGERDSKLNSEEASLLFQDFQEALKFVRPSAMREISVDVPTTRWSDIGGQAAAKQSLREAVEWPLQHPEAFARLGIAPLKGVLLYGPPGCSKTMMAKALATESKRNFIAVKGPELFSKWVGESEKAVQRIFRKARQAAPSIIFFDEIDALAVKRSTDQEGASRVGERVLAQLLIELDGVRGLQQVAVIAATNRPDLIDSALLRPGRIDRMMHIGLPDLEARVAIFKIELQRFPHDEMLDDPVKLFELATMAEGRTGAEISMICREAATLALRESLDSSQVTWAHYIAAVDMVPGRISEEMLKFYHDYQTSQGNV